MTCDRDRSPHPTHQSGVLDWNNGGVIDGVRYGNGSVMCHWCDVAEKGGKKLPRGIMK